MKKFYSIEDIRRHNENNGFQFFDECTMGFFSSRVSSKVYPGGVFVTHEKHRYGPRLYTVRQIDAETGHIRYVGDFQGYSTLRQAHAAAAKYSTEQGYVW